MSIFGSKETRRNRRLDKSANEALCNLFSTLNIYGFESRGIRWGHPARMEEMKKRHTKFLSENVKVRNHMEDMHIDTRIILKLILNL
jgi:hypothetical protein